MSKPYLIDGDPFAYRAAFSAQGDDLEEAIDKADDFLEQALHEVSWDSTDDAHQVVLTGTEN